MPKQKNRSSLLQDKMTLERSLRDLSSGKGVSHLSQADLHELIVGLKSRLAVTNVALAAEEFQAAQKMPGGVARE